MQKSSKIIRSFFRKGTAGGGESARRCVGAPRAWLRSISDSNKETAYAELRDAVRELSEGVAKPMMSSAVSLKRIDASELGDLKVDELEELARSHYDGDVDGYSAGDSLRKAVVIWAEAASRGSVESKYSLAVCYREGVGVPADIAQSFKMMSELTTATPGYYLAHYALAVMYLQGDGVDAKISQSNREKAGFYHMKQAASQGVLPALHNIANCYASGRGVKQSDHNAQLYYSAAAEAGDPAAKFTLGTWIVQGRGGLPKDLDKAFTLQLESAEAGHMAAAFNVGCHLMTGQGCEKNPVEAAEWFEKAADEGNIMQACVNLANMCREGVGVPKNLERAKKLFGRYSMTDDNCSRMLRIVQEEIDSS